MATVQEWSTRVQIDPVKLARFMRSPSSGILRDQMRRAQRVKARAQQLVGVYSPAPGDPFAARRLRVRPAGTLRDSIVTRITDPGGSRLPVVMVGSDDPIAFLHHQGTPPHTIRARRKPLLVFYTHGHVVRVKSVRHPGTDANPYLTNALREAR